MHTTAYDVVVIGAGMAGLAAARAASAEGAGRVLIVNGEDRAPYKRTKVSKHLTGAYTSDAFVLMPRAEAGIERLDARVTELDTATRTLTLRSAASIRYEALVLASGAAPNHHFVGRSLVVRSAADGDRLNAAASVARSAAIIGGGVLGVEVADQLHRRGLDVTLFSHAPTLMANELTLEPARWLTDRVARRGVRLELDATVSDVEELERGFRVCADRLCVDADLVVECTGSRPETSLARAAGLAVDAGIEVDPRLAASASRVFAAGDCTQLADGRVPHLWHEAEDQGATAGRNAARVVAGLAAELHPDRPRRLKCEAFGQYLFSMEPQLRDRITDTIVVRESDRWLQLGFRAGALCMVVMTGDRARAKLYERAVWDGVSPAEARRRFELS